MDSPSAEVCLSVNIKCRWLLVLVDNAVLVAGKYSDGPNRSDEWLALGKTVRQNFA